MNYKTWNHILWFQVGVETDLSHMYQSSFQCRGKSFRARPQKCRIRPQARRSFWGNRPKWIEIKGAILQQPRIRCICIRLQFDSSSKKENRSCRQLCERENIGDDAQAQYANCPIKILPSYGVHDRFLFIDETAYHFGASLQDLGKKTFFFSKEDFTIEEVLRKSKK